MIAVASGQRLILLNPKVGDKMLIKKTDEILIEAPKIDGLDNERIKTAVQWATAEGDEYESGYRIIITHFKSIKQVTWHGKGDYFATVMPEGANRSALIHQLSKRRTQIPFSKSKGLIQCVLFHPVKPCFFVAVSLLLRLSSLGLPNNFSFSIFPDPEKHSNLRSCKAGTFEKTNFEQQMDIRYGNPSKRRQFVSVNLRQKNALV